MATPANLPTGVFAQPFHGHFDAVRCLTFFVPMLRRVLCTFLLEEGGG